MVVAVPTPSASPPPLYHRLPCPYTLATLDTVTTITIIGTIHPPYHTEKLLYRRRRPTVAATVAGDMEIAQFRRPPGLLLGQTHSSGSGSMQLTRRILEQSQCMSYRTLS